MISLIDELKIVLICYLFCNKKDCIPRIVHKNSG
jgi:hypothetical protein